MSEQIEGLRLETLNDGRRAVVADIVGGGRLVFGYAGKALILPIGGAERAAQLVERPELVPVVKKA